MVALITDIRESRIRGTGCNCCPNLDYKKSFHFLISWKQWTGTTVSCTALPALELMTGKNLKSPDCCLLSAKAGTFSDIWSWRNNAPSLLEYDHSKSTVFCQASFWLSPTYCLVYYSIAVTSPSPWPFFVEFVFGCWQKLHWSSKDYIKAGDKYKVLYRLFIFCYCVCLFCKPLEACSMFDCLTIKLSTKISF